MGSILPDWLDRDDECFLPKGYHQRRKAATRAAETTRIQRLVLIYMLGGKCSCKGSDCWHDGECLVDDVRCLQLDHINGDGAADRREHGGGTGIIGYYYRHPEEAKGKLQVLCANCNWVKKHNNREIYSPGDLYWKGRVSLRKASFFGENL